MGFKIPQGEKALRKGKMKGRTLGYKRKKATIFCGRK